MGNEILTFGDTEIEKKKKTLPLRYKSPIF